MDDSVARALDRVVARLDTLASETADRQEQISADHAAARQRVADHVTALAADMHVVRVGLEVLQTQVTTGLESLNTRVSAIEILTRTAMVMERQVDAPQGPPPPQEFVDAFTAPNTGTPVAVPLEVPGIGPVTAHVDPDPDADPRREMSSVVSSLHQHRIHPEESRGHHPPPATRAQGSSLGGDTERPPGR